jgi:hypothetical protein
MVPQPVALSTFVVYEGELRRGCMVAPAPFGAIAFVAASVPANA